MRKTRLSITIDTSTYDVVKRLSDTEFRNVSQQIDKMLKEWIIQSNNSQKDQEES